MAGANSPNSKRRAVTAERKRAALVYRIGGKTFAEIGELLGISAQAAHKLVASALAETAQDTAETAEQLRQMEYERLNFLRNAIWSGVLRGDAQAVAVAIKISESIRRLYGLDAPAKADVNQTSRIEQITFYLPQKETPNEGRDI